MAEKINLEMDIATRGAERSLDGLSSAFKKLAGAAAAVFAGKQVADFFSAGVDAAVAQEKALARLGQQLRLTGEFSKGALDKFGLFADEMERTTTHGDDLILSQLAVAKSFGVSNEAAQKLVIAATELSAATGTTLEASVQQLGKTFSGVTGKLDEQIPVLKTLTKAQLEAGGALDVVIKRFGGSATAELDTFSGAVTQTKNAVGNLQESFGSLIVQNPVVVELIKKVGDAFRGMTEFVDKNKEALTKGINEAIITFIDNMAETVNVIEIFGKAFKKIDVLSAFKIELEETNDELYDTQSVLNKVAHGFVLMALSAAKAVQSFQNMKPPAFLEKLLVGIDSGQGGVTASQKTGLDNLVKDLEEVRYQLESIPPANDPFASVRNSMTKTEEKTQSLSDKLRELSQQLRGKAGGPSVPAPAGKGGSSGPLVSGPVDDDDMGPAFKIQPLFAAIGEAFTTIGKSFAANLLAGGKEGARNLVGDVGGAIATAISGSPEVGGAVAEALKLLGQDPEAFRSMIDGFVKGIPEIIDNIVLNIPYLIESLAANSGEIITALVSATPRIAVALAKSMPIVAEALAQEIAGGVSYQISKLNGAADYFQNSVFTAGQEFGTKIISIVDTAGQRFITAMVSGAQQVLDAITPGGGGDPGENVAGFFEDPVGTTSEALGFGLTGGGSGGGGANNALLLRVIELLERPITVSSTISLRDQAMADIILNLNRRNARLSA